MSEYLLRESRTGQTVAQFIEIADSFWSRFVGLQGRRILDPHRGLLIVPCASIHTCWVRFPIDITFLDRSGIVLGVRRHVRPWRMVFAPRRTHAILEMNAGETPALNVGTHVELVPLKPSDAKRASVDFLMATNDTSVAMT